MLNPEKSPGCNGITARYGKLLDSREAAKYIGLHLSTIQRLRCGDIARAKEGESIQGPQWLNIGRSVYYTEKALESWIESRVSIGPGLPPAA